MNERKFNHLSMYFASLQEVLNCLRWSFPNVILELNECQRNLLLVLAHLSVNSEVTVTLNMHTLLDSSYKSKFWKHNKTIKNIVHLRSWCSGHTIVRFHTLYVNPAITEETPTPSNCPAGECQVNINSFSNHQLSLISTKTGKTSFQVGWTWTNPLPWTWKRRSMYPEET